MAKNKNEVYLPLLWTDKMKAEAGQSISKIPPEYVRVICEAQYTESEREAVVAKDAELRKVIVMYNSLPQRERDSLSGDLDALSVIMLWAKNKQVYKLDKDFLDELINTDTMVMTENIWDYLPYDTFYINISDNPEICQRILGNGFFVKIEKPTTPEIKRHVIIDENLQAPTAFLVHLVKVNDEMYFSNIFGYDNANSETNVEDIIAQSEINVYPEEGYKKYGDFAKPQKATIDGKLYKLLVAQILTYWSSSEPDIEENENTTRTYKKPAPGAVPKNKFSEIQQWDIGVRYGSAFRKWKKENANPNTTHKTTSERSKQRPHSRRAHWSHYWYGSGDNKVRRPKWVASYFVNTEDGQEQNPTTIHQVAPKPNDKGEDT